MKVILLENVKKIGSIGEIIDVKRCFARNYLIANKKAYMLPKKTYQKQKKLNLLLLNLIMKKQKAKSIFEKLNKKIFSNKKTQY